MATDCPFCRIAAGEDRAHVLFRNDRAVAILDANPAATGHTLVVPREHVAGVVEMDGATTAAVFDAARTVAGMIDRAIEPDGFSLFHTTGTLVGRIEHAHVHLIPRRAGDAIHVGLERTQLDGATGERLAARIRDGR